MALSEFQKAFKAARASGEKEFEYEGKKYNTKYKEESESSVKPSQDASKMGGEAVGSRARQADSSSETSKPKKGIGPYNVFSGPDEPSAEASAKASKSLADKSSKYQNEPTFFNPLSKENRERMGSSYKKGGSVRSSASSRADGIAQRGKTKGRIC